MIGPPSAATPLGLTRPVGSTPPATSVASVPFPRYNPLEPEVSELTLRDQDRTITGLLLLAIGFGLLWIPYVSFLGEILGFVGVILVFLGRGGYGADHRISVNYGATLIVIAIILGFFLVISIAAEILSIPSQPGITLSQAGSELSGALQNLFVGTAAVGILASWGEVLLVRGLSDPTTSRILWLAFAVNLVLNVIILIIVLPLVQTAVNEATSTSPPNLGPVDQLQTTFTLLGLVKIVPSLMFLWGYVRARDEAMFRRGHAPVGPRA